MTSDDYFWRLGEQRASVTMHFACDSSAPRHSHSCLVHFSSAEMRRQTYLPMPSPAANILQRRREPQPETEPKRTFAPVPVVEQHPRLSRRSSDAARVLW